MHKGKVPIRMVRRSGELGKLLPNMRVEPPGPKSKALTEVLTQYETPTLSPMVLGEGDPLGMGGIPVAWKQARGANLIDMDDNLYVDLTAGFCVAIAGHCHPKIVRAIQRQAEMLTHAPAAQSPSPSRAELLKKLAEVVPAPLKRSHFLSGGGEAMDVAMKLARLYTKSQCFIAFHGGFHGKTFGALSLTSRKAYRRGILPLVPGVFHVPFADCYRCPFGKDYPECDLQCLRYLEYVITDPATAVTDVAAIFLEPIEGHEGWIVPPKEFLPRIRKICSENNILMVLDEIITGFGRTGKMFCFQHYGITPDILVCGKGMASGFPISAVVSTDEIMGAWEPFQHTSTFSANPLGCAAGVASLSVIQEERLVERSAKLGDRFLKALHEMEERYRLVGDVRGMGLMVGVELVKDKETKEPAPKETGEVIGRALKKGVFLQRPGGRFENVLKISPPLVITEEQLDFGVQTLDEVIGEVERKTF